MKRKILTVIPVLALLGSMFGFAASMGVSGVEDLGSGTAVVSPPEIEVTCVEWTIVPADYTKVGQVKITVEAIGWIDTAYGPYDFYFILKDSGGGVIAQRFVPNTFVNTIDGIHVFEWDFGSAIDASLIAQFGITVVDH